VQVTAVDATWLAEMGPMFFTIKDSLTSRMDQKKKSKEKKGAMEIEMSIYQVCPTAFRRNPLHS
jgi:pre-mRNA-splicing factor ATP-dependent RNA helicase DHX38/PRP16